MAGGWCGSSRVSGGRRDARQELRREALACGKRGVGLLNVLLLARLCALGYEVELWRMMAAQLDPPLAERPAGSAAPGFTFR